MPFSANEFRSRIGNNGVAFKSDFEAKIYGVGSGSLIEDLTFRIEETEIPGRSVQTIDYRDHGVMRKIGYNAQYADIAITIICSRDLKEKELFDNWQDLIVGNHRNNGGSDAERARQFNAGYYDDYVGRMDIIQYDRLGKKTYHVKLEEVYPLQVSPLQVSWSNPELQKLNVTLAYRYYTKVRSESLR